MTGIDLHNNSEADYPEVGNDPMPVANILIASDKIQLNGKGKLRGRPWPRGVSGNPKGRPRGARNKFSLAVLGSVNTPPMKPGVFLDKAYPFIERGGFYIQRGRKFHPNTKEAMPGPVPPPPEKLDRRWGWGYELVYQGRRCIFTTEGWLFDRTTLLVID